MVYLGSHELNLPENVDPGFPWRLENLENENGHGKVMEHEIFPKVMKFCDQSWNFTNFASKFVLFLSPLRN